MTETPDNYALEVSAMSEMAKFAKSFSAMPGAGDALIGVGEASGDERALRATQSALSSPLWKNVPLADAKGVMVQVIGSRDITLKEVGDAMNHIYSTCAKAHVYYSHAFDESMVDRFQITVIASGFPRHS